MEGYGSFAVAPRSTTLLLTCWLSSQGWILGKWRCQGIRRMPRLTIYLICIGSPNVEKRNNWPLRFLCAKVVYKKLVSIPTLQGISAESQNCVDWIDHEVSTKRNKNAKCPRGHSKTFEVFSSFISCNHVSQAKHSKAKISSLKWWFRGMDSSVVWKLEKYQPTTWVPEKKSQASP